jgi:hypothetical protein
MLFTHECQRGDDFWLFDNEGVAVMRSGDLGVSGAEMITDPGKVL